MNCKHNLILFRLSLLGFLRILQNKKHKNTSVVEPNLELCPPPTKSLQQL